MANILLHGRYSENGRPYALREQVGNKEMELENPADAVPPKLLMGTISSAPI
jgi:hypothetical protein